MKSRRWELRLLAGMALAPCILLLSALFLIEPAADYRNPLARALQRINLAMRITQGIAAELDGHEERAVKHFSILSPSADSGMPVHPLYAAAVHRAALSSLLRGDAQRATEYYQQISTWSSPSFDQSLALFLLAVARGDEQQAMVHYNQARILRPLSSLPGIGMFNAQVLRRQGSKAQHTFNALKLSFPDNAPLWLNWSRAQAWLGNAEESKRALETARGLLMNRQGCYPSTAVNPFAPKTSSTGDNARVEQSRSDSTDSILPAAPPAEFELPPLLFDVQLTLQTAWKK